MIWRERDDLDEAGTSRRAAAWRCSAAARWAPRWCGCCTSRPTTSPPGSARRSSSPGWPCAASTRPARSTCPTTCSPPTPPALVARDDVDLVVEVIGGIEPARSLILAALEHGASVVTANKALLAEDGPTLFEAAEKAGRDLYYEAAVAGAIPIVRPLRESLAGDRVTRVLGIVNGTTNFILDKMDTSGAGFAEALEEAQDLGYAEADPTADVEGFDAAAKAAILASLAFHSRVTAADVHREGITDVTAADVASAREMGAVVKLLAICELRTAARRRGERRGPRPPGDDPAHPPAGLVREAYNAVFVESEAAGQLMFYGPGRRWRADRVGGAGRPGHGRPQPPRRHPRRRGVGLRRPGGAADGRDAARATTSRSTSTTAPACSPRSPRPSPSTTSRSSTVRQEGRGDDAQLVVVSHEATDAALRATVAHLRGMDDRARGHLGHAGRGGDGVSTTSEVPAGERARRRSHQWRGVIEEYRDLLDIPAGTPGGHAAGGRHAARALRAGSPASTGAEVRLKVEGDNPTGLLQGPRHDRGDLGGLRRGCRGGRVRLDRQHLGLDGRLRRARPGSSPSCSCPRARSRLGKMAQAIVHGAQVIMVRGNFDDCLDHGARDGRAVPGGPGQLGQPACDSGPEDGRLRDRRLPRRRPRTTTCCPSATPATSRPTGWATPSTPTSAGPPGTPVMRGFQAAGAAPLVHRRAGGPTPRRRPPRSGSATPPRGTSPSRRARSPGGGSPRSPTTQILAAQRDLARHDGVFVEPASAAGVAGLLQDLAQGRSFAGSTMVVTVTGHGLKDTVTALEGVGPLVDAVVDADVAQAAEAAGLQR